MSIKIDCLHSNQWSDLKMILEHPINVFNSQNWFRYNLNGRN